MSLILKVVLKGVVYKREIKIRIDFWFLMDYKFNIITPSLYSKAGNSNYVDNLVEDFDEYVKFRAEELNYDANTTTFQV